MRNDMVKGVCQRACLYTNGSEFVQCECMCIFVKKSCYVYIVSLFFHILFVHTAASVFSGYYLSQIWNQNRTQFFPTFGLRLLALLNSSFFLLGLFLLFRGMGVNVLMV